MHKFRGAVLAKRATCCPRAAPAMFGQRGHLPPVAPAPLSILNVRYCSFLTERDFIAERKSYIRLICLEMEFLNNQR
jgi:hypothetical protein